MGFRRKVGWEERSVRRLLTVSTSSKLSQPVFFGEFFRLDLKDPFLGSLMIQEGGMAILRWLPRSHTLSSLLESKQESVLW